MIRFIDFILASILLLLLTPLFILISVILKFTGEGDIFYRQLRVGQNRNHFFLVKFATMKRASPTIGAGPITLKNDFRILPFGALLRRSKLNELPQLFNILLGQMSFIGPRPMTKEIFSMYSVDVQNELIKIKPGLSGIGSIIFRNEENLLHSEKDSMQFYEKYIITFKGRLELWFIKNSTPSTYIKIFLLTIYIVLFPSYRIDKLWKIFPDLPQPDETLSSKLNLNNNSHKF